MTDRPALLLSEQEAAAFMQQAQETLRRVEATQSEIDRRRQEVEAEAQLLRQQAQREADELLERARAERERLLEETAAEVDERTASLLSQLNQARTRDLMTLVREAQQDALQKAEAAATWQARAEMLAAELHVAREQLRALQATELPPGLPAADERPPTQLTSRTSVEPAAPTQEPADDGPRPSPADEPPIVAAPMASSESPEAIAERLRLAIAGVAARADQAQEGRPDDSAPPPPPRTVRVLPVTGDVVETQPVEPGRSEAESHPAEKSQASPAQSLLRRLGVLGSVVLRVFLAGCVVGLAALLAPLIFGYQVLPVVGGSMEPTISLGSVVLVKPVTPAEVAVGDVITFSDRNKPGVLVTHRVVSIDQSTPGRPSIHTKGDANNTEDAWDVPTDQPIQKVFFWVPMVGYLVAYLASPQAKFVLAGVIGLLLLYLVVENARDRSRERERDADGSLAARSA